jgi:hypothetical protein
MAKRDVLEEQEAEVVYLPLPNNSKRIQLGDIVANCNVRDVDDEHVERLASDMKLSFRDQQNPLIVLDLWNGDGISCLM